MAELYDITVEFLTRRRQSLPARFNNSIVSEPIGLTDNQQHSAKEDYKTQFLFPVLDQFLQELNNRFGTQSTTILKGVSACSPTASNFLSLEDLKSLSVMYNIPVTSQLEVEVNLVKNQKILNALKSVVEFRQYLHLCQLAYQILFQLTSNRPDNYGHKCMFFSALKRIKTRLMNLPPLRRTDELFCTSCREL